MRGAFVCEGGMGLACWLAVAARRRGLMAMAQAALCVAASLAPAQDHAGTSLEARRPAYTRVACAVVLLNALYAVSTDTQVGSHATFLHLSR